MASDSANPHRGAHDGAIASLLDKHESRVDLLLDSMLTYLKKTQPSYFEGEEESLASRTIADVLKRVSSDAASESTASEENRLAASLAISEMTTPKELKVTVSPSAQQALERAAAKKAEQIASPGASETDIPLGTKCSHNGCEVCFAGPSTYEASVCVYHTGTPVFHEGLKFWSCCNKVKVTDFGDFLNIKGCCTGRHEFSTKDETMAQKRECRSDFFQQGATVSFNIYAKLADPTKCSFTLRRRPSDGGGEPEYVLSFHVHFEGEYDFKRTIVLAGPVDIDTCLVDILQPKIEIKLKKADGRGWNSIGEVVEEDEDLSTGRDGTEPLRQRAGLAWL